VNVILFFVLGFIIAGQNPAVAAGEEWRTNTAMLPQYCKDRAKGVSEGPFTKWRKTFGEAYIHMHHYCGGVYAEHKARGTADNRKRGHWLGLVVHQMQYVSKACQVGCVLYPELHSRWGWALGESRQYDEAIKHYQLAIQAKKTYTTAYAGLSDLYIKISQPDDARKILDAGLKARPGSRKLQRRLKKLGSSQ